MIGALRRLLTLLFPGTALGCWRFEKAASGKSMAYCPPELLDDLADVLAEVRTWAGVIEKKSNVFYVRRQPFLHFHLVEGRRRRADVKGRSGWLQIYLPRPVSSTRRRTLLRVLRTRYREK
ncbi:MAG TPA: hypothetical protein VID28_02425 [Methylomirabilota bacterium]